MLYVLLVLGIIGLCVLLYGWWDTNRFDVRKTEIKLERLPAAFDGFTILQVSDLHNRAYGKDGMDMIRTMEGLSFDCIAITGDLLDRHRPGKRDNGYRFAQTAAKLGPAYCVQGNHEWKIGDWPEIRAELTKRGVRVLDNGTISLVRNDQRLDLIVRVLDNETISLVRNGQRLDLIGCMEKATLEDIQPLVEKNTCSVLLAHHPERITDYARMGVDLVLSGHAHGGHIRLFGNGLYSPDQGFLPRYTSGAYTCGNTKLYVSRGAGNHTILLPRIFNRPEIDLITLKTPSR